MSENARVPEIVNGQQTVNIGGLPVPLSPQLLQALSGSSALTNLNPLAELQQVADESRGSLVPMMVTGLIERKKSRIITANLREKRLVVEERTALFRSMAAQVKATEELAQTLLESGSLSEIQRLVLSMQYPQLAKRHQEHLEYEDLQHQVRMAKERCKLDRFTRALKPKDPKAEYQEKLTRQRDEALLAVEHAMATFGQVITLTRQIRQQITNSQFEPQEREYLEDRLQNLLSQLHIDTHGSNARVQ